MKDETINQFAVLIALIVCATLGFLAGANYGTYITRQQAIKHNVGCWTVNQQTGETQFVFGEKVD